MDVWQPAVKSDWPTQTIFNYVYASTAIKRWSHPQNSGYVEKAKVKYAEIANAGNTQRKREADDKLANSSRQNLEHQERWEKRSRLTDNDNVNRGSRHGLSDDMGPGEMLWLLVWAGRMERGGPTPMPYCKDVEAEKKIESWRLGVSSA